MDVKVLWICEIFLCILAPCKAGSNPLGFKMRKANKDRLDVKFSHPSYFWSENWLFCLLLLITKMPMML